MPAFAQRILIGPKCLVASLMLEEISDSDDMSPVTVKRFVVFVEEEKRVGDMGRWSCPVTLQPWSGNAG